jgi:phosphate starvation-inducible PhoH-like protein
MPKKNRTTKRPDQRPDQSDKPVGKRNYNSLKQVTSRNEHQQAYLEAIENNTVTISCGPAGSGKTYLAVYEAACHHWSKKDTGVERIIITRPAIEAGGEKLGFLPGQLEDKMDPYMRPIYDSLYDIIGIDETKQKLERGYIEIAPVAFMRGRTFNNAFIIVDEAQNATIEQLKMVMTRVGENCKIVLNGDATQSDLHNSGLPILMKILKDVDDIALINFGKEDIVRSQVVISVVDAFERYENNGKN